MAWQMENCHSDGGAIFILGETGPVGLPIQQIGLGPLWLASPITTITGYDYLRAGYTISRQS